MKKISYLIVIVITVILFPVASCKKNKTLSPELVTVNGQTFGCRVNGTAFIADKWDYGNNIPPIRIRFRYSNFSPPKLQVIAEKENNSIEICLNSPFAAGTRELKFATRTRSYPTYSNPLDYGLYQVISPAKEYITNDTLGGLINILFVDTINQKIEARFEFIGTNSITGEKVIVTDGYFKKS